MFLSNSAIILLIGSIDNHPALNVHARPHGESIGSQYRTHRIIQWKIGHINLMHISLCFYIRQYHHSDETCSMTESYFSSIRLPFIRVCFVSALVPHISFSSHSTDTIPIFSRTGWIYCLFIESYLLGRSIEYEKATKSTVLVKQITIFLKQWYGCSAEARGIGWSSQMDRRQFNLGIWNWPVAEFRTHPDKRETLACRLRLKLSPRVIANGDNGNGIKFFKQVQVIYRADWHACIAAKRFACRFHL